MPNPQTEYRCKSFAAHGRVELGENDVTCDITSHHGRWKIVTPYASIEPHPTFVWRTPPLLFFVFVGLVFLIKILLLVSFLTLKQNGWSVERVSASYFVCALILAGMSVWTWRYWKQEEWIIFPTKIPGYQVAYFYAIGNREAFDEITRCLKLRIAAAQRVPVNEKV